MFFLVAKIVFLLVLAALGGAALMYWWVRRQFEDVSVSHIQMEAEQSSHHNRMRELQSQLETSRAEVNRLRQDLSRAKQWPQDTKRELSALLTSKIDPILKRSSAITEQKVDLNPVLEAIRGIQIPETDLGPVLRAVASIEVPAAADLSVVERSLERLEEAVDAIDVARPVEPSRPIEQRANLLKSPEYGKPDDLKEIKGVGPKLEKLLHKVGVYYFWQVAEWSPDDVCKVDDLLDSFKGRIQRDNWVLQASSLSSRATAARRPAVA